MDEIDKLAEQPEESTRRAINTVSFDFDLGREALGPDFRDGLLEALRADGELQELHATDHPQVLGIAVDPPERRADGNCYCRVHIDFSAGRVDSDRVREIIDSNLKAELLAVS